MIEEYKCIMQDSFSKLKLDKIYKIKNKRYIVSDLDDTIILFGITQWQLKNLFKSEVRKYDRRKKIPKRIQSNGENLYSEYIGQWLVNKENYTEYDELLMNKINEIIDYLQSKGE